MVTPAEPKGRVLLVDDEPLLLRAFERILTNAGYEVATAPSGEEGLKLLGSQAFDVVVSDITMPGMSGMDLLRRLRQQDLDLPLILVTGQPSVQTAMDAVQYGAFRYLSKPLPAAELVKAVHSASRLYDFAKLRRDAHRELSVEAWGTGDRASLDASLNRALAQLWMAYQPIVSVANKSVFAYEALMRTTETTLPHPPAILKAAERLGRTEDVVRSVRAAVGKTLAGPASEALTFVNLHVRDMLDETMYGDENPLVPYSRNVVLEITERASLDEVPDIQDRIGRLRKLGFRIALDDLGVGYSGLASFARLEPDFVKIDISLIQNIDTDSVKRKLVQSIVGLARDLGVTVIAEGIERPEEAEALQNLHCDLLQGYLFARPGKPFPNVNW